MKSAVFSVTTASFLLCNAVYATDAQSPINIDDKVKSSISEDGKVKHSIKIKPELEIGVGGRSSSDEDFNYKEFGDRTSDRLNSGLLYMSPGFSLKYENASDKITYGLYTKSTIKAAASGKDAIVRIKSSAYFKPHGFGEIKIGNYSGLGDDINLGAHSLACAFGGIDGSYLDFLRHKAVAVDSKTEISDSFVTSVDPVIYGDSSAIKLGYTSESFKGVRFAFAYIPDAEIMGTMSRQVEGDAVINSKYGSGYTNGIITGLHFKNEQNVPFSLSFIMDYAKPKISNIKTGTTETPSILERNTNLSFSVGASADLLKSLSLAGSFTYFGDSGTIKSVIESSSGNDVTKDYAHKDAGNYLWTLGARYKYDEKTVVSVTYLNSSASGLPSTTNNKKPLLKSVDNPGANGFYSLSVGCEYKFLENVNFYLEGTKLLYYKADKKDEKSNIKLADAFIVATGLKISF